MQQIHIRAIAAKIMIELCDIVNSNFSFNNFNTFSLFDGQHIPRDNIVKASKYLIGHKYVNSNEVASEHWSGSITIDGIDWVEDFLNIDHTL